MDWQIAYTLGIVLLSLAAMVRQLAAPDVVLMGALFALAAAGILTPAETFSGFANPAVATIGALFILSAGLRETGALDLSIGRFLARARGLRSAEKDLVRLLPHAPFTFPLRWVPMDVSVEPADRFREWLTARLTRARATATGETTAAETVGE